MTTPIRKRKRDLTTNEELPGTSINIRPILLPPSTPVDNSMFDREELPDSDEEEREEEHQRKKIKSMQLHFVLNQPQSKPIQNLSPHEHRTQHTSSLPLPTQLNQPIIGPQPTQVEADRSFEGVITLQKDPSILEPSPLLQYDPSPSAFHRVPLQPKITLNTNIVNDNSNSNNTNLSVLNYVKIAKPTVLHQQTPPLQYTSTMNISYT